VHRRDDAYVYFHEQHWSDMWVPFSSFGKMTHDRFQQVLDEYDAARIDPRNMPAAQTPDQN
jgi:hypothetical protein